MAGCTTTATPPSALQGSPADADAATEADAEAPPPRPTATGTLDIDVTSVLGVDLRARVDLLDYEGRPPIVVDVASGQSEQQVPVGPYRAYVHVFDNNIPVLAAIEDIEIEADGFEYLLVTVVEGAGGPMRLRDFDQDGDLAIDRVEIEAGTDPQDPSSIPGKTTINVPSPVLRSRGGWFRGELYARSNYGQGSESVAQLVRRAERSNLDFLAIADADTMASVDDPGYTSDEVVLIPAVEWGTRERGRALIYAPKTLPETPATWDAAQAEVIRVQVQGGIFAIAHPAFTEAPWEWGLSFVNAVQVWYRGWRDLPSLGLTQISPELRERENPADPDSPLIHSIAAAAAASEVGSISGNSQSAQFWDYELARGLIATPIAGSGTGGAAVPMARPVTYVRAAEKSMDAIVEGMRTGQTYVTSGLDGPTLIFQADVLNDGTPDVAMGGIVPMRVPVTFEAGVRNAEGKKVQVLLNGRPIVTKRIEGDAFAIRVPQLPDSPVAYRMRVVGSPERLAEGFGPIEVYAMSGPIYVRDINRQVMEVNPEVQILGPEWQRIDAAATTQMFIDPSRSVEVLLPPQSGQGGSGPFN